MTRFSPAAVAALLLAASAPGAAQTLNAKDCKRDGNHVACDVDWSTRPTGPQKISLRVTPKQVVRLRTMNFNYVFFDADWIVAAKEVPGYRYLESQWADLLGIGVKSGGGGAAAIPKFLEQMQLWRSALDRAAKVLADTLDKVPRKPGLTPGEAERIASSAAPFDAIVRDLNALRDDARKLILIQYGSTAALGDGAGGARPTGAGGASADGAAGAGQAGPAAGTGRRIGRGTVTPGQRGAAATRAASAGRSDASSDTSGVTTSSPIAEAYYAQAIYDAELKRHAAIVASTETFVRLANDVGKGRTNDFDRQKSGTIVTATTKAVARDGRDATAASDAGSATISWFVQSELPLAFHFGPGYTNFKQFDFEKVQRPSQGDLFQQIDKPRDGADLVALMTYMLTPDNSEDYGRGFGLTIGTGVRDIGKRIYLGATAKFNDRLFLTAGGLNQSVKEGETANAAGDNLFTTIKNVQKWGFFAALSVSPF